MTEFNPDLSWFRLVESSLEDLVLREAEPHSGSDWAVELAAAYRDLRRELGTQRETAARERANFEAQLTEAQGERDRARKAVNRKAEALAHMSHELRTPMNGILGMTHLVLQTELSTPQRESLEVVNASANVLLTLINDILDLSKLGAGRLVVEAVSFDLRGVIRDSVRSVVPLVEEKGLEVEIVVEEEVPAFLVGDPGRLRQVLLNLVSNAVKFSDGGQVSLAVEIESVAVQNVQLRFRVTDEGIGISPDRIETIFEPYTQAEHSTSGEYGGTGLGLAICRDLLELMHGRIWAESVEGEGTTLHFTALFGVAPDARCEAVVEIDELADLTVYVLAAEGAARPLIEQMDAAGIRHAIFDRLDPALRAMSERRPDIAVIDLDRYELEVLDRLDRDIRTIVVASSGQRGDAARCRELGVAAYLTRPLGPLDLRDAVRAVVAQADDTLITRHWLREHRQRPRVLAADDVPANRDVLKRMLESQGCVVVAVSDGREAVEAFDAELFDLILMDVEMPNMNGIEAARALRDLGAEVPIIALTGHSSPERIQRCLEAGMTGYLGKPFKFNDLLDAVESAVSVQVPDA